MAGVYDNHQDHQGRPLCCASAYTAGSFRGWNRCAFLGKVEEDRTVRVKGGTEVRRLWFCKTHSSEAVNRRKAEQKERDRVRDEKWQAGVAQRERQRLALIDVERFRAALQKIADGTNDARAVAREALGIEAPAETY